MTGTCFENNCQQQMFNNVITTAWMRTNGTKMMVYFQMTNRKKNASQFNKRVEKYLQRDDIAQQTEWNENDSNQNFKKKRNSMLFSNAIQSDSNNKNR